MSPRWFNGLVVLFWLSTMSWLVVAKILPSLLTGEPPSYKRIVLAADETPPSVAWDMFWDEAPIGHARSQMIRQPDGMTEIESHVRIESLPLAELTPPWMSHVLRLLEGDDIVLDLLAESSFAIDPLGHLASFRAKLDTPDGLTLMNMQGVVNEDRLKVTVRADQLVHSTEMFLPADALVGDAFSPREQLPNLHIGQTWTVPVFSPFQPPTSPMEVLRASVERQEFLVHGQTAVQCWLVVYRADNGGTSKAAQAARGRVWVRTDGMVLKQEMLMFEHRLTFVRAEPDE
ncbi:MAG: hypothetical protein AB7O62_05420 [Pirellulales bacterium]